MWGARSLQLYFCCDLPYHCVSITISLSHGSTCRTSSSSSSTRGPWVPGYVPSFPSRSSESGYPTSDYWLPTKSYVVTSKVQFREGTYPGRKGPVTVLI